MRDENPGKGQPRRSKLSLRGMTDKFEQRASGQGDEGNIRGQGSDCFEKFAKGLSKK